MLVLKWCFGSRKRAANFSKVKTLALSEDEGGSRVKRKTELTIEETRVVVSFWVNLSCCE